MEPSRPLQAEAKPYIPLVRCVRPPPVVLPSPGFFPQTAPYLYQAPTPQAGFLGGVQGCWGVPLGPGGVGMQGAFPPPAWQPLMPMPPGAIPMPAGTPCITAGAKPQVGGKQPSGPARTVRAPGARPRPSLHVPPRAQPAVGRGAIAESRDAKAAGAGGDEAAKEETANEPSPRSVLVTTSPPISPTTSLPASFPQPCLPPATDAPLHSAKLGTVSPPAVPPRRKRLRRPRRAPPASGGEVRRSVPKPRRLFDQASKRTTLMIRNIPNDFTRRRLMCIIDQHCFIENEKIAKGGVRSEYDFLYVPIDFRTLANKGYAFVNMTSPEAACRLWEHLHGHRWEVRRCGKTCAVDYAAKEGLEQMLDHFSASFFDCDTEAFLPVRFEPPRDGTRPAEGVVHVVGRMARRRL